MKVLGEHNSYRFDEFSGDGYLYASAIDKGVQLQIQGYSATRNDYVNFGLSTDEAGEIQTAADVLLPLVPTLDQARTEHEEKQARLKESWELDHPDLPYDPLERPFVALAPVVHEIEFTEEDDKTAELKGGLLEPEELVVVGGLTWAREQLLIRFDGVNTLVFRPEAFAQLAVIGATQPEFPPKTSIWDRLG